jgi:peroxiredoxin
MIQMRWINLIPGLIIMLIYTACQSGNKSLKEGLWRGVFILPENEIPFVFEVKGQIPDSTAIFLINGTDRFQLNHIYYRKDSIFIPITLYDAVIKCKRKGNSLNGRFIKYGSVKGDEGIPFKADWGESARFPVKNEPPLVTLTGTWDIDISYNNQVDKTVGIFKQNDSSLTGSILTTSGDYRYLEGIIYGKRFILSEFCGSTPYLLKGEFLDNNNFTGEFITPRRTSILRGKLNPKASLPDPYNMSHLKEGYTSIDFTFPNLEGKMVSLSDSKYKGKVVIVTLLGSWCPNCLDENTFLSSWYKVNRQRGVEIIGLGFERRDDFSEAQKSLSALKNRLGIQYEILIAGKSTTESASKALPALTAISAFPTTLFIDKPGNVRKIHTGFSGPATGKFYDEFKTEFNELIDKLLAE